MLQIVLSILFVNHLMACFWYMQAKLMDFPSSCWVVDEGVLDADNGQKYMVSFYWAF